MKKSEAPCWWSAEPLCSVNKKQIVWKFLVSNQGWSNIDLESCYCPPGECKTSVLAVILGPIKSWGNHLALQLLTLRSPAVYCLFLVSFSVCNCFYGAFSSANSCQLRLKTARLNQNSKGCSQTVKILPKTKSFFRAKDNQIFQVVSRSEDYVAITPSNWMHILADLKKTLAVLLDNIMLRLGKLESKVENIYNGTGGNLTNGTSTVTPSSTNPEKVNVAGMLISLIFFLCIHDLLITSSYRRK